MTGKIGPALTAEEWKTRETDDTAAYDGFLILTSDHAPPSQPTKLIALLNDLLPDSDPRKITRARLKDLNAAIDGFAQSLSESDGDGERDAELQRVSDFADALESYLPSTDG